LHVVTPLAQEKNTDLDWPVAKAFAREICRQMAEAAPHNYLLNMSKNERKGRIFLDYLRNDRLSTAVGPLSPRAREGAPVSMPVHWSQMRTGFDPLKYTIRTAPGLLAKNKPWEDYDDGGRSLVSAIHKVTNTSQASLAEGLAEEKPRRKATTRKSGGGARKDGARKGARKMATSHRSRSGNSGRIAGRP
jgi:bifunctional non-homologous end joining protein LigD